MAHSTSTKAPLTDLDRRLSFRTTAAMDDALDVIAWKLRAEKSEIIRTFIEAQIRKVSVLPEDIRQWKEHQAARAKGRLHGLSR